MKTRLILISGFLAIVIIGGVAAIAFAGTGRVAADGDPYHVSARRLHKALTDTGVHIRYVHPQKEKVLTVSGVARVRPAAAIGFEFQLYPSSDEATALKLGDLRAQDFGWPKPSFGVIFEPIIRGVLGNVAFAEYEDRDLREAHGEDSRQVVHRTQLAAQHLFRALDNALFNSFPPSDPYAHALSARP